jgi:hypothetical protein
MFTQPDSLIQNVYDPQSLNRYSFERNNPYKHTDPTGHTPDVEWGGGGLTQKNNVPEEWLTFGPNSVNRNDPPQVVIYDLNTHRVTIRSIYGPAVPHRYSGIFDAAYAPSANGDYTSAPSSQYFTFHQPTTYYELAAFRPVMSTAANDAQAKGQPKAQSGTNGANSQGANTGAGHLRNMGGSTDTLVGPDQPSPGLDLAGGHSPTPSTNTGGGTSNSGGGLDLACHKNC